MIAISAGVLATVLTLLITVTCCFICVRTKKGVEYLAAFKKSDDTIKGVTVCLFAQPSCSYVEAITVTAVNVIGSPDIEHSTFLPGTAYTYLFQRLNGYTVVALER